MNSDLYKVLNITEQATPEEVQRAYRALARQYHPDRNHSKAAAALMASINEAYEVLGKPKKRLIHDRQHARNDDRIGEAVLRAARETLIKKDWIVSFESQTELGLKKGSRQVRVALVSALTPGSFQEYRKRAETFCVILALRIEPSLNMASNSVVVIDLMYSRVFGTFPDDEYRELFRSFFKTVSPAQSF